MLSVTVYRYYNTVNSKSYIGITTRPNERHLEHKKMVGSKKASILHKAIEKYGIENIQYTVLDIVDSWEKAVLLEKYYIEYFDTFGNGYNVTRGGEGTYGRVGEKCSVAKLTDDLVFQIIMDDCTSTEAAKKYGTTRKNIDAIRRGKTWSHLDRSGAPNYQNNNHGTKLSEEIARVILMDSASHKTASEKYHVSQSMVKDIRKGKSWKNLDRTNLPIYRKYREEILDAR